MAKTKKTAAREFVLDGSITLAWCFPDERKPYSQGVLNSLDRARAWVPSFWPLEVANALLMGERRKRSTEADTIKWLSFLAALPIAIDDETVGRCWPDALPAARLHNLSVYDAAYLELALRRGLPLASMDDKLNAAASTAGVVAYGP